MISFARPISSTRHFRNIKSWQSLVIVRIPTDRSSSSKTAGGGSRRQHRFEEKYHLGRSLSKTPEELKNQETLRVWHKKVNNNKNTNNSWTRHERPLENQSSAAYEIKALEQIHSRSFDTNVLLEIRDVRVPASSHHPSFNRLAQHRLHLIYYTHADTIDAITRDRVEQWTIKSWPDARCVFVDARENRISDQIEESFGMLYDSLLGRLGKVGGMNSALTVGVANTGKSSLVMALIRLARIRKLIPRQLQGVANSAITDKTTETKAKRKVSKIKTPVGIEDKPGKTRSITEYLLGSSPRTFFLDVPGMTCPHFLFEERPEAWFASCAANLLPLSKRAKGDVEIQTSICDYVLHCANRDGIFHYVPKLGLNGPTTDIQEALSTLSNKHRDNLSGDKLQLKRCEIFLKLFNTGNFGPIILDDLTKPFVPFQFRDDHFQRNEHLDDDEYVHGETDV